MNKYSVKAAACALVGTLSLSGYQMTLEAKIHNSSDVPAAGVAVVLDESSTIQDLQVEVVQNIAYLESASGLQPNIIKAAEKAALTETMGNVILASTAKTVTTEISSEFTQELSEALSEVESEFSMETGSSEAAEQEETRQDTSEELSTETGSEAAEQEETVELSTELKTEWDVPELESLRKENSTENASGIEDSIEVSEEESLTQEMSETESSSEEPEQEAAETDSEESFDKETTERETAGDKTTETVAENTTETAGDKATETVAENTTETTEEKATETAEENTTEQETMAQESSESETAEEKTTEQETVAQEDSEPETSEEVSKTDTSDNNFQTSAGFSATDTYDDVVLDEKTEIEAETETEPETKEDEQDFSGLVIAQVTNYVNVRSLPGEDGEVVGKLYSNSVGELVEEENGWYKIVSGNCTGYVKGEFCAAGKEAESLAKEVGTTYAVVNTTTLKVRQDASTESAVLGLVPINEELVVLEELDGWVKIAIEEGDGYVSRDYINLRTDFVHAESKEEEAIRLAKEAKAREEARAAAAATEAARLQKQAETQAQRSAANQAAIEAARNTASASEGSEMGKAVIDYATQFVGNPYVYGGSSLTNGTDCSGFVMSVYNNFGVSLPHSSSALRNQGYDVGGLANAQPGDIVCYSGHVGLYVGNGQIVHASTSKTGIIVSNAAYRNVLSVRRIF